MRFVLEERMAQTEDQVAAFLNDLAAKAKPAAKKEWDTLQDFARHNLGLEKLEKWDTVCF